MGEKYYLGFDFSTQSLTAIVTDGTSIVKKISKRYDELQPDGFGLEDGVWKFPDGSAFGSPDVWLKSLDFVLKELSNDGLTEKIAAISGSAQQHGSVYLSKKISEISASLKEGGLTEQASFFSRYAQTPGGLQAVSPIWMDNSTTQYMDEIVQSVGLEQFLKLSGNGPFERFTGSQIRKFYSQDEESYKKTQEIHLISSFFAGLLSGKNGVCPGDATGMSLMNIESRNWSTKLLLATAPDLLQKLPTIVNPLKPLDNILKYFCGEYGFNEGVKIYPFEGDNPSSLIGMGGIMPGRVIISLGTSDTFFGNLGGNLYIDEKQEISIFGAPTGHMDNMYIGVWKNGSLGREKIKNEFNLDWDEFSDYLLSTEPDPDKIGIYWFDPEITPRASGVYRSDGFSEQDKYNVKAIVESKILSMMIRLGRLGIKPEEIYVTGGGSQNPGILQVIADIAGVNVYRQSISDSAALGAALRARHGYLKSDWQDIVKPFNIGIEQIIPNMNSHEIYTEMLPKYEEFEKHHAMNIK